MPILIFRIIFILFLGVTAIAIDLDLDQLEQLDGLNISQVSINTVTNKQSMEIQKGLVALKTNQESKAFRIAEDISRILQLGWVQDVHLNYKKMEDKTVQFTLKVTPNPVVLEVEFVALTAPQPEALKAALAYRIGETLNYHRISHDIGVIEKWYVDQGYVLAKVVDVSFIQSTQTLVYTLLEGKIHDIRFVGLNQVNPLIIQRLLEVRVGSILNTTKLLASRSKIINTGLFSQVSIPRVIPSDQAPGEVDVLIDVQERKINNLQVGLEQLQNNKLSLALTLKLPNFRNTGEGLFIKGQSILESNFKDYSFVVKYTDPWFLNNPLPFGFSLYQQVNQEAVNMMSAQYIKRAGWDVNWDFGMGSEFHYILAYKNEQINDVAAIYSPYKKNSLRHIIMNQVNIDLNNPLEGQRFYAEYERGGNLSGIDIGGIDFTRGLVDYAVYWNTYKKDVLALHLGLGAVAFVGSGQTIFEQDRFTVGGAYSLRGYPDVYSGSLGSMIGNKKILINLEYRMLLQDWLQTVLFLDAGMATDGDLAIDKVKCGRGMGFRVFTPIAPLRFDFAFGESNQFLLHFALGQLF